MSHDREHRHHQQQTDHISVAFFLNLGFTFVEIGGGMIEFADVAQKGVEHTD